MGERTLSESLKSLGLKVVFNYLDSDPENNIPKVFDWIRKFDKNNMVAHQMDLVESVFQDEDNIWHKYMISLYRDIDNDVRKTLFENFLINSTILGGQRRKKAIEENNCNIP